MSMSASPRAVIAALLAACREQAGVVGIVVATEGSTYAKAGALLSLGRAARAGWISGGCLEPALEAEALRIEATSTALRLDYDTRDEMDLMFGSRIGCRGLLRVVLIPLRCLSGIERLLAAWLDGDAPLQWQGQGGLLHLQCGELSASWAIQWECDGTDPAWTDWQVAMDPAPRVLVLGAGPETASLLPLLRDLGARVDLVERRPRWTIDAGLANRCFDTTPAEAIERLRDVPYSAVLVMNHEFELDRVSLQSLAAVDWPWLGLLGPPRRRDDLLSLLQADEVDALSSRLHAPAGLALGGRGPAAIAVSIAAQLQQWWAANDG